MDTKSNPPGPPVTSSQGSLQGRTSGETGNSERAAPVRSVSAVSLPLSPSANNAVSPVSPNSNLPRPSAKRDSAIQSPGAPPNPAAERKSPIGPREQPKDFADTATLTAATTRQSRTRRHRRHSSHTSSSRGPHQQTDVVANRENHHGKRCKPKVAGVAGCHSDDERMLSHELLSSPAIGNERQPKAPSRESNLEIKESKVADEFTRAEQNSLQRRSESADEGPRVVSSSWAATSENARCDESSRTKEDGSQTGTTASHGRTLVGTTASSGADEPAGWNTVGNPGGGTEGGAVRGVERKKPTGVNIISPHAQARNVRQTARESGAALTSSHMTWTQKTSMTGHSRTRKSSDIRSAYTLSTLKDLATTLRTDSQAPGTSQQSLTTQNLRYVVVGMAGIAVLFTFVVSLLLWIIGSVAVSRASRLCSTPACGELAAAFENVLNYSVDPCEDMHAFVCSKGIHRSSRTGRGSLSLVANVFKQYELQMVKMFLEGQTYLHGVRHCSRFSPGMRGDLQDTAVRRQVHQLFRLRCCSVAFRCPVRQRAASPGVRLDAHSHLWHQHLVPRLCPHGQEASVRFQLECQAGLVHSGEYRAAASASFWLDFVRTVEAVGGREKYHELFLARYNASLPDHGIVAKRLAIEKDILSTLDEARFPRARLQPVVASLAKIAAGIPNTHLGNWIDPVVSAPGGSGTGKSTLVVVRDVHILHAVGRLLTTYSVEELMRHLSWWLVQILTVIGWPDGYVVIAGSQEIARSEVKVECYRMMASSFALLLASESSTMLFTPDSRLEIQQFFLDLVDFMKELASRVPWLSDKDKTRFAKTLGDLQTVVWPPDVETSNETLWLLYESFCTSCGHRSESGATPHVGLIEFWLYVTTRLWHVSIEQIERMQLLWQWDQLELLHYDPWFNQLRVSHAALRSPIYQPSSPELRKANFGALGTFFFLYLLQMFEVPVSARTGRRA
ncbi:uncharacterized protein LOC125943541 [Dermacentor silvarum]|uniref:uncharacterized protein LOC125943541 n=1 Tax=Dermacentor silvarum TaxID=543639 RepID=UPI002100DA34|nr:uncharacterized protein LOC125943541 [Dermacentor silvarum]